MELLPRGPAEFGSSRYWERFFRQRGRRPFEWYGAFPELCPVLRKYIRPRDKVRPRRGGLRPSRVWPRLGAPPPNSGGVLLWKAGLVRPLSMWVGEL